VRELRSHGLRWPSAEPYDSAMPTGNSSTHASYNKCHRRSGTGENCLYSIKLVGLIAGEPHR